MNSYDYTVVGAGLTGATFAWQKAEEGHKVLVFDKRNHVAGNAYDKPWKGHPGAYIHNYGPHLFHTNSDEVFEFLSLFTGWRPYEHRVVADISPYGLLPLPVNFRTMEKLFRADFEALREELLLHFKWNQRVTMRQLKDVGLGKSVLIERLYEVVYEKVFKNYTEKMWGLTLDQLGPTVADRVPLIIGDDDRYFSDKHQYLPADGYSNMVESMLRHPNIEVRLSTRSVPEIWSGLAGRVLYTGPIDEFFNYEHGKLPYRSIHFDITLVDTYRPLTDDIKWEGPATHNYPNSGTHTRVSSMASIAGLDPNRGDVRVREFPRAADELNQPYYPVPTRENRDIYAKYEESATQVPGVRFAGRLGTYQYLNMDQAVAQALKIAKEF